MADVTEIAAAIRDGYARSFIDGMKAPTLYFADRFWACYVPPRPTDGWFEGQRLRDYQEVEEAIIRSVLPDAQMTDVTVITRATDQVIAVSTLSGTLKDGAAFAAPITMVYDVKGGEIVRVVGLYDPEKLDLFSDAFEEAAKTQDVPIAGSRRVVQA
jgi:ketosteroid isomerase-like protein